MKKLCLAICLLQQLISFGQIQFDSCFVYRQVDKKDIKESELLFEFFQLSGSACPVEKLLPVDVQALTDAVNRATNMNFAVSKIPENSVFMRCHSKGVLYGFVVLANKHMMIDAARNVKLVFENTADIDFINRLDETFSYKKSMLHGK